MCLCECSQETGSSVTLFNGYWKFTREFQSHVGMGSECLQLSLRLMIEWVLKFLKPQSHDGMGTEDWNKGASVTWKNGY